MLKISDTPAALWFDKLTMSASREGKHPELVEGWSKGLFQCDLIIGYLTDCT